MHFPSLVSHMPEQHPAFELHDEPVIMHAFIVVEAVHPEPWSLKLTVCVPPVVGTSPEN